MSTSNILSNFYETLSKGIKEKKDLVIVISKDGIFLEDDLENKPYNHSTLTCYMALKLGLPYMETNFPTIAAKNLTDSGAVVLHIHQSEICICFFPSTITKIQYELLEEKLSDKKDYLYQYDEKKPGFVYLDEVLGYANSVLDLKIKSLK